LAAAGSFTTTSWQKGMNTTSRTNKDAGKASLNYLDTQKLLIDLKKGHAWLYDVNSQSLQMSLRLLDNAFKSFFHKNAERPTALM